MQPAREFCITILRVVYEQGIDPVGEYEEDECKEKRINCLDKGDGGKRDQA